MKDPSNEVWTVTQADLVDGDLLDVGAEILAAAFSDYPWTRWVIDANGYERRLLAIQRLYLAHGIGHGLVQLDSEHRAISAWLPADAPDMDSSSMAQLVELHGESIARLGRAEAQLPAPHGEWVLATIGVKPEAQGLGLGTALLDAGIAALRSRGVQTLSLQTSVEANVRLYERHGFAVTIEKNFAEGVTVWVMEL